MGKMKVIIADDEVYICSLIKHLIDWEGLGLELAGIFANGDETAAFLAENEADILICDVEMPGMNGLELMEQLSQTRPNISIIVISGYRNFEYALSALKYGAVNYLLKPLDQKELNDVLRVIVTKSKEKSFSESVLARASSRLQFLDSIVKPGTMGMLEDVNQRYHYSFAPGLFNVICAVFPGMPEEAGQLPVVYRMFESILRPKLQGLCHEAEIFHERTSAMCIVLNCTDTDSRTMIAAIDSLLQDCMVELSCKTQKKCFVGVGVPTKQLSGLNKCFVQASGVLARRFTSNNLRIFYADEGIDYTSSNIRLLTMNEKNALQRIVEEIDPTRVRGWVESLFDSREEFLREKPWMYLPLTMQAAWQLAMIAGELVSSKGDGQVNLDDFLVAAECCAEPKELQQQLTEMIETEIRKNLISKLDNVAAYAQGAKQYIDKHYMENITLKSLACELGINPSYLSVLFKNELQMNYSEYLLSVRMEHAKKMLRQRDRNLSQIANAVGYDRVSYFSKLFRNYTGLKPAEYRRLHQNGLGD